jgi:hypothetical protein
MRGREEKRKIGGKGKEVEVDVGYSTIPNI